MSKRLLVFLFICLPLNVLAGEATRLDFIGFSKDGKYLAFQQYGIQDGAGTTFARMVFIESEKNKYAARPIESEDSSTNLSEADIREINLKAAETTLDDLGIIQFNTGDHVISRPLTDLGADPHEIRFAIGTPLAGLPYSTYKLTLEEHTGEADCFGFGDSKMFTLSLYYEGTRKTQILQADKQVPKSRGCVLSYRIQDVYVYEGKHMIIFLNMIIPGFEGQSMRLLGVSGELD